jgi:chromosome segregation protein
LQGGQSVVTPDGVWLGRGWVRISRGQEEAGGLISREHDIRELRDQVRDFEQKVIRLETDRRTTRKRLGELEIERAEAHQKLTEANRYFGEAATVLASLRQDFDRLKGRMALLTRDSQAVRDELESMHQSLRDSKASLEHATTAVDRLEARRPDLEEQREQLQTEFDQAREKAGSDQATAARINVEFESRRASRESASTTLTRISAQRGQLQERVNVLSESISSSDAPLQGMQDELDAALRREVGIKRELDEQRRTTEAADTELRTSELDRTECEGKVAEAREQVDDLRMHVRETQVRREGIAEQFAQLELQLEAVVADLDDAADVDQWDERLTSVKRRIDRLGAINLAAIEEYEEQSERQKYLEAQFEDLTSALETLEGAIRKIDRETRTRFKETFDNVNAGIRRLFPKLFGGGHAYLSLDSDDLLNAGVTVMAQPPGKRNSTIHLLSGGEKALTAVSLVFSIFELNPAPFCLLDEVDAPLDDANVGRFCDIVREMSESVQFLCITHNKTTMEMASQLTGVTMNEPGVSRLVSVDIDEAVKLVAS